MERDRKSYICHYQSGGAEYSCRIDAASPDEAARIMNALPWAPGSGPIGEPKRHHPQVDAAVNYAVAALRHMRQLMSATPADAHSSGQPVRRIVHGG